MPVCKHTNKMNLEKFKVWLLSNIQFVFLDSRR